jgi:hypothetical protein
VYYFLLQPAQPAPPRADWGGRRRSAEVFCPTALIPTDISFLISRPLSLQSRCFFSCSVWVRFFFFSWKKKNARRLARRIPRTPPFRAEERNHRVSGMEPTTTTTLTLRPSSS